MAVRTGQLDLTAGLSGSYSETKGGEADFERARGRVELGLNYTVIMGQPFRPAFFMTVSAQAMKATA